MFFFLTDNDNIWPRKTQLRQRYQLSTTFSMMKSLILEKESAQVNIIIKHVQMEKIFSVIEI